MDRLDQLIRTSRSRQEGMLQAAGINLDEISGAEHHRLVIEYIGHAIEELVELRCCIPRRYWRNDEPDPYFDPEQAQKVSSELADVWIILAALSATMGAQCGDDVWQLISDKWAHNMARPDHIAPGSPTRPLDPDTPEPPECW